MSAKIIELYEINFNGVDYYYTSAPRDVVFNDKTYKKQNIKRSNIKSSTDVFKNDLKLSLHAQNELALLLRSQIETAVSLKILSNIANSFKEFTPIWHGRLMSIGLDDIKLTANFEDIATTQRRNGLTPTFQHACPHVFGSKQCGAKLDPLLTLTAKGGLEVNPPNKLGELVIRGGRFVMYQTETERNLKWQPGAYQFMKIGGFILKLSNYYWNMKTGFLSFESNDYDNLWNLLKVGDSVMFYAYCRHTLEDCKKHENLINYGGFPYMSNAPNNIGNLFYKS